MKLGYKRQKYIKKIKIAFTQIEIILSKAVQSQYRHASSTPGKENITVRTVQV